MSRVAWWVTLLGAGVLGSCAGERGPEPMRILAASSLTEVVDAVADGFAERLELNVGASGALARQIRDGAPGDVFLSASPRWVESLAAAGEIDGDPVVIARNRLVCVAGEASRLVGRGLGDPRGLLEGLRDDERLAIADAGVPAGEYAREALSRLGLLHAYEPHFVGQRDVRAVLHAVAQGELSAGFVYATDVRVAPVKVLFEFDPNVHSAIEYQAVVLRRSRHPERARRLLDFLEGEPGQALLSRAGFAIR